VDDVVAIVLARILGRFTNVRMGRKEHCAGNVLLSCDASYKVRLFDAPVVERPKTSGYPMAGDQAIQHHWLIISAGEQFCCMASDISGPACHENALCFQSFPDSADFLKKARLPPGGQAPVDQIERLILSPDGYDETPHSYE
jgi:hypothetical protein